MGTNYNSGEAIFQDNQGKLELIVNPDDSQNYSLNLIFAKDIDSSKFSVTKLNDESVSLTRIYSSPLYSSLSTPNMKGTDYDGWKVRYDGDIILYVVFIAS